MARSLGHDRQGIVSQDVVSQGLMNQDSDHRDWWLRHLTALETVAEDPNDIQAWNTLERVPTAPIPTDLGSRAASALDRLRATESTLATVLAEQRREMQAGHRSRRIEGVYHDAHGSFDALA